MNYLMPKLRGEYPEKWQRILDVIESSKLPNPKRTLILVDKLKTNLNDEFPQFLLDEEFSVDFIHLLSYSQFLGDFFVKNPNQIEILRDIYKKSFFKKDFEIVFPENIDENRFKKLIRFYHRLQMGRVVLRDIRNLDTLLHLTRDVTIIHDSVLKLTLQFANMVMEKRYGIPENSGFCIVDMGKAAGCELNYSSDLDLIYVYYSRYGRTSGGTYGSLDNHDYFSLLSEYITRLIGENTKDGRCFEVDLRLRPNGTMGPVCNDIEALEEYYTAIARPWERFALLKSRPSVGDLKVTGMEFVKLITPFVYRKYIDFTLIEEVLRLKELIKAKVSKKFNKIDVKLGHGGIREIEFIVQAFQIIYGGKNSQIRSKNTLIALEKLRYWGFLTEKEYLTLKDSYKFLRRTEHMLQITNFRQTQTFHPESEESNELALKLGFESREVFLSVLKEKTDAVNYLFERFFPTEKKKTLSSLTVDDLKKREFFEPEEIKKFIDYLFNGKLLSSEAQNRLDLMGETFIDLIFEMPDSRECMKNLVAFLEKKEGNLYFLSYLKEMNTLKVILMLLSTKQFFMKKFLKFPEVLEYMFDPEGIEKERSVEEIKSTFDKLNNEFFAKELEEIRVVLRYLLNRSDVKTFNEEFTNVADVVIGRVCERFDSGFAIASLGKHGSREMNIGSDIDILFIFKDEKKKEDGFIVLQRFIKELKKFGYEIDTRLRPFGEKGELGFTINYMKKYFAETARTWERLAYTRFRVIEGDKTFRKEIEKVVESFLFSSFGNDILEDIFGMRERLRKELARKSFLKYGSGGIVDSEFIAYTYQLSKGFKMANVYDVLSKLSKEKPEFKDVLPTFIGLRMAETERRLYGKFIKYNGKIEDLMRKNREIYTEFFEWIKASLNMLKG